MVRFKELCMDTAGSGEELGRFWAAVTGCSYADSTSAGDPGDVVGEAEGMGIAICPVPEEKTVKNRVHLDVLTDSVDSLLALGARRAPGYGGDPWTVLLDPEGGELCAFVRDGDLPAYRGLELVLDSVDPEAQARWWGAVFGSVVFRGFPWRRSSSIPCRSRRQSRTGSTGTSTAMCRSSPPPGRPCWPSCPDRP